MNTTKLLSAIVGSVLFVLLALPACTFKSPSLSEQEALAARGAFPNGLPAWMPASAVAGRSQSGSGFLPGTFIGASEIYDDKGAAGTEFDSPAERIAPIAKREQAVKEEEKKASAIQIETSEDETEDSPLNRILGRCPGLEDGVKEALVTTDVSQRISKYRRLTSLCPSSADLWLWLGRDHLTAGQTPQAKQSLERALLIDSSNEEASKLLSEIRGKE